MQTNISSREAAMAQRPKRNAAMNALESLWQIDITDSDGNDESSIDSDTDIILPNTANTDEEDNSSDADITSDVEAPTDISVDAEWRHLECGTNSAFGRTRTRNIFSQNTGITKSTKRKISCEFDAFDCFIDERVKKIILESTRQYGIDTPANLKHLPWMTSKDTLQ